MQKFCLDLIFVRMSIYEIKSIQKKLPLWYIQTHTEHCKCVLISISNDNDALYQTFVFRTFNYKKVFAGGHLNKLVWQCLSYSPNCFSYLCTSPHECVLRFTRDCRQCAVIRGLYTSVWLFWLSSFFMVYCILRVYVCVCVHARARRGRE